MQQVYHSNAKTNLNIRSQIQNKTDTNSDLALRFGVSEQTVSKWKNRDFQNDVSSRPLNIKYSLSELERAMAISLRTSSWSSIDEVWENLLEVNPTISRSSIYRCFVNEKINQTPTEHKEKAKKFKEYEPGYLHIDVTYLPKFNGKSSYLFVAIDRCTRLMTYAVYENKTAESTEDFMDKCFNFFPFYITHILTDNGLEFTNRLLKSKTGNACQKLSKMDVKCIKNNIEHRLTEPFTPKTNGMVERVNGIIKSNTNVVSLRILQRFIVRRISFFRLVFSWKTPSFPYYFSCFVHYFIKCGYCFLNDFLQKYTYRIFSHCR